MTSPLMNNASKTNLKTLRAIKVVEIEDIIWPKSYPYNNVPTPWIMPGRYYVVREFDKDRYIIRLTKTTIAVVKKALTKTVS